MKNDYGSLVERWKVDLITARARKKGFRTDEIDDAEQEIVPAIIGFVYDPEKSNGATETTALTALIDRQLTFIQRGRARRHKHEQRYRELSGVTVGRPAELLEDDHRRYVALKMDVQATVARLSPMQQAVCAGLLHDEARRRIAKRLGISRYGLDRLIDGIRDRFKDADLDGYRVAE